MRDKRIWVINQFAGTPTSGWGERHFYFAKYWKQQGYDVKIISGSYNHMFKNCVEVDGLYKHEVHDGIDFFWVKTPKYNPTSAKRFLSMLGFARNVLKLPVNELGIPSSIIVSSMPIFSIWSGIKLKRKYKSKLLFEIRDIWPLTLQLLGDYSKHHPAVKFIGWFEKIGYRKSDTVVSLLPNAKEHFETVAGKPVDFAYIPNGIDTTQLKDEKLADEFVEKLPKNKFVVGYAGTLGMANALEHFVGAAEQLKENSDIHFVLVGDGYLKEELQQLSKSWGNVTFLPKIKKNQVQHLLSYFDVCFVGRSGSELFKHGVSANKYFDYMLAAKPILDSNNYIKDPVELSGGGIIVEPDSPHSIKHGVETLYGMSPESRVQMGEKGRKYVLEHHFIGNLANEYLKHT